jgi:predicted Zn-dependent protease
MMTFRSCLLLCLLAARAFADGDLHERITALTAQIEKEPRNAALHHQRGELHRVHEDFTAALADYDRAAALDPQLEVVHLSRGRAQLEAARPEAALPSLSRFLALHPAHAEALVLRARAHALLARHRDAEADFAAALAHSAEPAPDLFIERARNLTATAGHEQALAVLTDGIRRLGPLVVLEDAAIETELALGRTDAALARLDTRLAAAPRKEALLDRKARVLLAAGRTVEAQATFREALEAIASLPEPQRRLRATARLAESIDAQLATKR